MKQVELPTVKPEMKKLILAALERAYTSVSCKDGIQTGNHYQSLTLGDEHTAGFRSDRSTFLDRIDFRGKRVLDLGSNLGEISRAARARGADVVDGYEYDQFFVELAQAINAYNGATRVSFYQSDITKPDSYRDRYDLVLAFSVFTYLHGVLDRLAEVTSEALIVETHKLDGNLEKSYLAPVRKFLPIYEVLGESDWGRSLPDHETRAVIAFARDQDALDRALGRTPKLRPRAGRIDLQRTMLQRRFFETVQFPNGDSLLADVRAMDIDLAVAADAPDIVSTPYSGRTYWFIFLKGYCQYLDAGAIGRGNIYYDYIIDHYAPRRHDPGVSDALKDPLFALQRVAARFADIDRYRQAPHAYSPIPVTVFQSDDPSANQLVVYEAYRAEPLYACAFDGWHRLFAGRIFGAATIPAEVVEAPTA
jgi:SAM-dependent methyltransferase